jgi:hypothetical protein
VWMEHSDTASQEADGADVVRLASSGVCVGSEAVRPKCEHSFFPQKLKLTVIRINGKNTLLLH